MNQGSSVLAVVDEVGGVPVVWWVDVGPRIAGMSRLCGAWVLSAGCRRTHGKQLDGRVFVERGTPSHPFSRVGGADFPRRDRRLRADQSSMMRGGEVAVMDVVEVLGRVVGVDLATADLECVRVGLADAGRVRSWLEGWEIAAKRRLDELCRSGIGSCPENDLVVHGNITRRDAERVCRRDRALADLPQLGGALADGEVSGAHLDVLARGLGRLQPAERRRVLDCHGVRLAELAARSTPDRFAVKVNEFVARAEVDGGIGNFERQRRANRLRWWTDQLTGMLHLRGELDPEAALKLTGRLRTLVEELFHGTQPDTCPDDPALKQGHLRALALIALVEGHTTNGNTTTGSGTATSSGSAVPDVIVVVDEQTLRDGIHRASIVDVGSAEMVLPVETLRRLACVANIIPVVLNSDGVTVDLGRGARLASRAQRRALRVMYPTCAIPGCRVSFEQCTIHHIRYWESGGGTDLAIMVPVCGRHHHAAHEGGWQLHVHPITRHLTITYPDGTIQTTGPPRTRAG